jgi:ribosomal-protein-alanine N-acetyltransferase
MLTPRSTIPELARLPLVIDTPRLRLRPFTEDDIEAVWPTVSDPEFPRYMSWHAHSDRASMRAFVQRITAAIADGTGATWAIVHDGRPVGCIGFDNITWELGAVRVDRAELGYWLVKAAWNRGMMTEAATAIVRFGFETLGLHKITVRCFLQNAASRRVIEKVGFRYVGRLEDDVWRNGRWWSHLRFELTAQEWRDVQPGSNVGALIPAPMPAERRVPIDRSGRLRRTVRRAEHSIWNRVGQAKLPEQR